MAAFDMIPNREGRTNQLEQMGAWGMEGEELVHWVLEEWRRIEIGRSYGGQKWGEQVVLETAVQGGEIDESLADRTR